MEIRFLLNFPCNFLLFKILTYFKLVMQVCFVGNFNFCSCLIQPGLPMAFRADGGILLAYYRVSYCQAFPTLIPSQYRNNGNINKMGSINNYDLGTLVLCIGRYNHTPILAPLLHILYHYCIGRYNHIIIYCIALL